MHRNAPGVAGESLDFMRFRWICQRSGCPKTRVTHLSSSSERERSLMQLLTCKTKQKQNKTKQTKTKPTKQKEHILRGQRKNALPLKKWVQTYMAVIPRLCTANRSFLLFCFILLAHEWLELLGEEGIWVKEAAKRVASLARMIS